MSQAPWYRRRPTGLIVTSVSCLIAAILGYLVVPNARQEAVSRRLSKPPTQSSTIEVTAVYGNNVPKNEAWWQATPRHLDLRDLPAAMGCPKMRDWLRSRGGIDRGWSDVTVTIRARRPARLIFKTARSRLVSSRPATAKQTLLCVPDVESGVAGEYQLNSEEGFLLDRDGYSSILPNDAYSRSEPIDLGFGEVLDISFKAFARACDCTWRLELDMLVDGQPFHSALNDLRTGRPFRTLAAPSSPGDPKSNVVWCAPTGVGRLTLPSRRDCPIPVEYETPIYK